MTHTPRRTLTQPFDWQKWLVLAALGLVAAAGAWYLSLQVPLPITISVPIHDLPMYHLIYKTDLMAISVPSTELSSKALRSDTELVGHYTQEPLAGGKAILVTQLVPSADPALNTNTTVITIPATEAMTFGGQLTSGDIIKLWEVPNSSVTATTNLLLDQGLVLDVLPISPAPTDNTEALPYVVILAVPVDRQVDILSSAAKGLLMFTLRP